jgi:alkanesulfonate monooxygenase SsuD/methylene tetrahydromethanopterin reductase-like flavin-dependent oxidoreductase (luciferase family)
MKIHFILEPDSADRFLELGRLAESYGFEAVWTANHLSARDPFMSFAALARESTRIRMGPVAVSPFELHPLKMANLLFSLNELSGGRANIVVGGGGGTMIAMNLKPGRYVMHPRMVRGARECVEFLHRVSATEPLNYTGELFQVHGYQPGWAVDEPPLIYVGATKPQMLRMAAGTADGVMFSDLTLGRLDETMAILNAALAAHDRDRQEFRINNLFAWHVKANRTDAVNEAKRKLWVRGMVERWYISPVLDEDECELVQRNMPNIIKAYMSDSPNIEGIAEPILDKLVEELTFTGDLGEVDRLLEKFWMFKNAGVGEMGLRLYDAPEESIKLIGETIGPELN